MKSIVKNKFFIIGVIVVLVGFIAWTIVDTIRKSATIVFEYTPSVASLYLNDKKVSSTAKVEPGTYMASVRREGFTTYEEEVVVAADESYTVYAVLESNSPETASWYSDNLADDQRRQRIYSRQIEAESARLEQSFPIRKILPYMGPSGAYRIDYGMSKKDTRSQAVYIRYYSDRAKELAEEFIISQGYKLQDYEVIYELLDYTAPDITVDRDSDGFSPEDEAIEP